MSSPCTFAGILSLVVTDRNTKLNLAGLDLTDADLATLASKAKAGHLQHVEDIDISKTKLSQADTKTIAEQVLRRL